ncbi:HTH-type transcriptional repressor ComR [compost metagenome]
MLLEVAREMTAHNRPAGCMLVTSAMNCATEQVRHHVAELRAAAQAQLQARIERGIQEGDVPANASATNLAAFYTAILQGLTIQARDGASAEALTSIAEHAMDAWPT